MAFPAVRCRDCGKDIDITDAVALTDPDDKLTGWKCADRELCAEQAWQR